MRYDLNEVEKKSRLREFFAQVINGKFYEDRVKRLVKKEVLAKTNLYLNATAECLADGNRRMEAEFNLEAANILDRNIDAIESVDYIVKQNCMAAYCLWAFDKKGAEDHLAKANEMQDNLQIGVTLDTFEKLREKGVLKLTNEEAMDKLVAVAMRKNVENFIVKQNEKKSKLKAKRTEKGVGKTLEDEGR